MIVVGLPRVDQRFNKTVEAGEWKMSGFTIAGMSKCSVCCGSIGRSPRMQTHHHRHHQECWRLLQPPSPFLLKFMACSANHFAPLSIGTSVGHDHGRLEWMTSCAIFHMKHVESSGGFLRIDSPPSIDRSC